MTADTALREAQESRDTAARWWRLVEKKWSQGAATGAERGAAYRALAVAENILEKARRS